MSITGRARVKGAESFLLRMIYISGDSHLELFEFLRFPQSISLQQPTEISQNAGYRNIVRSIELSSYLNIFMGDFRGVAEAPSLANPTTVGHQPTHDQAGQWDTLEKRSQNRANSLANRRISPESPTISKFPGTIGPLS